MKDIRWKLAALAAAAIVAACGGGETADAPSSKAGFTSVKVMGDSLSDSGVFLGIPTYGRVFSVNQSASEPNTIWTERLAVNIGTPSLCNYFKFTGTTFVPNPTAGCTSYGVGGSRINNPASSGGAAAPLSIVYQLQVGGAIAGTYKATDLLLMDGGGNDAAALVGAYLGATTPAGQLAYAQFLGTLLNPLPPLTNATDLAKAGGQYMVAVANQFAGAVTTNALNRGATRIAILNAPDITGTPRFQTVLDGIAAASGGGTAGATARAQAQGLFQSWVVAFNTQLSASFAGDGRVVIVDFYTDFQNQLANPAQFGLTNVKTPACPITGVGTDGLPTYNFQTCTAAALSANPPAGVTGGSNWWTNYAFSDSFHPTPYGYQLMSQLVSRSLAQAGWL